MNTLYQNVPVYTPRHGLNVISFTSPPPHTHQALRAVGFYGGGPGAYWRGASLPVSVSVCLCLCLSLSLSLLLSHSCDSFLSLRVTVHVLLMCC